VSLAEAAVGLEEFGRAASLAPVLPAVIANLALVAHRSSDPAVDELLVTTSSDRPVARKPAPPVPDHAGETDRIAEARANRWLGEV
jgi:hypothetical protein